MTATQAHALRVVLHEGPGSRPLGEERRLSILMALLAKGYAVSVVTPEGGELSPPDASDVLVLRESAGESLPVEKETLEGHVDGASDVRVRFGELDSQEPAQVVELVERVREELALSRNDGWKPWFPVIDYD